MSRSPAEVKHAVARRHFEQQQIDHASGHRKEAPSYREAEAAATRVGDKSAAEKRDAKPHSHVDRLPRLPDGLTERRR